MSETAENLPAAPLRGFRIGVTAHRRAGDLIEALERRGAQVLHAPALKIAPMEDEQVLHAETADVVAAAPDIVMVTTAYGMRRWCESADAAGQGEQLLAALANAAIYVRGPKARGAVRAAGLDDVGISADETTATLTSLVIADGVRGKTVAVQVHGFTDVAALDRLRAAGATVLTVTPYRWVSAEEGNRLGQLIDGVINRELDVVTFTSAPAVDAVLSTAAQLGRSEDFLAALRGTGPGTVVSAAVGPVTAAPLLQAGITPLVPERFRMGALIRLVCEHLEQTGVLRAESRGSTLEVRGQSLSVDGQPVQLAPAPLQLLKLLMAAGGGVLSHAELASGPDAPDADHALHMAVSRLRAALPDPSIVETVVKRGYRLR
ncbi:uroporphyrinogen-III synthase [Arthrobacter stackebrandtii]|uniref:Uroporphyrinogen-III synthase n=1 Tax=Arthrobacter stackebrandtii TaxID=272161 RepID=A0ABS4YSN6_9MICC|nr:uroporphyrinogen-III synthase [Arthrobacter stackebrandtii]MBP2411500.1 uroporphyrinogen-III synthase [Arthrobacter stackebrandtii]PYH00228.1 uroporphyrinogen-III synthase [Arthrobacter stackebrandtii]